MQFASDAVPVWQNPSFWEANGGKTNAALSREFGGSDRVYSLWRKKIMHCNDNLGIAVADLHYDAFEGAHNAPLMDGFIQYVNDTKPGIFVAMGDMLNMTAISHWLLDGRKRGSLEGRRLKDDYQGFQRDFLDKLKLPINCRKIWLEGNHEKWVRDYVDANPEAEGFIEVDNNIDLSGWEQYRYGQHAQVGNARFIHGAYTNLHCAYKTAQVYGMDVYFGHGHTEQLHTLATPVGDKPTIGHELPCMCNLNPRYAEDKPNGWVNGFGTFYMIGDELQMYVTRAFDDHFISPNGKKY